MGEGVWWMGGHGTLPGLRGAACPVAGEHLHCMLGSRLKVGAPRPSAVPGGLPRGSGLGPLGKKALNFDISGGRFQLCL